jgi:hypothetical protein
MKTQRSAQPATTKIPPIITSLTWQKRDDGGFCLTIVHRRGRRTVYVECHSFRLDRDGQIPPDEELWIWGQVRAPALALADWEDAQLF